MVVLVSRESRTFSCSFPKRQPCPAIINTDSTSWHQKTARIPRNLTLGYIDTAIVIIMPPPPVSDTTFSSTRSLVKFSIHTSTQISSRTSAVLKNLQQEVSPQSDSSKINHDAASNDKPVIVALTASQPNATNKLITIVEITKRELAAKQIKCFQYNALSSEVVDVPRQKKVKGGKDGHGAGSESEGAFETMGESELGETKRRNVPSLTVYLSLSSVRELKVAYR